MAGDDYFGLTDVAVPSYLTAWSAVAVTSMPAPWLAPTHTTLKFRLSTIPVNVPFLSLMLSFPAASSHVNVMVEYLPVS